MASRHRWGRGRRPGAASLRSVTVSVPKSNVPRASVLIAARDVGPYIECAVRSALSQTLADIEVIVVDDASTDDTYARVQGIHDSRLRLFRTDGGGWARARNSVMAEAQGRYLAFLDGDDEWLPHHLECLVDYLDHHPGLDLAMRNIKSVSVDSNIIPPARTLNMISVDQFIAALGKKMIC